MTTMKVRFYIEGLSNDKKALERAVEEIVKSLKNEDTLKVENIRAEEILENPDDDMLKYSMMVEADLEGSFKDIVKATMKYAPVVVEVISPAKMEMERKELMKILGEVSLFIGELMKNFGTLAVYPRLDELPEPRIGYSREEIEDFIIDDREILYRFVVEVFGEDQKAIEDVLKKAFDYEGAKINKIVSKVQEEKNGKLRILAAAELISSFENLFQLTGKFAPVAISIMEPEMIDVSAPELQNVLTDLASFVYELIHRPIKKKLIEHDTFKIKLS
ncbi:MULTISPECIES: hypothetical protein [Thermococcus]|uniref:Uncharacterized protein n=2 Tax=Thermococcus sibiricus TaxID=172049 RepID=C6A217_THESM|nr:MULTISPECIES: hypothetical protein [Thermococcus]ACS89662.1 hypothetical protein TSIB_0597 [Thermococcus sibiricus MM 739]KUK17317.1 MAG: Uncharacterized protein XD54_1425 [Thermococcus sibiricus]MBC7094407.1 hypothetical protein [Thermococcus sp.]HII68034.1 hypothetical protein [Thermococcaceae archaeon]